MDEFGLIEKYFKPLAEGRPEAGAFENDASVLSIPDRYELVVTNDHAIAGVHFFPDQPPETIAKKALRRNLSDLNAMGAEPYCYQMGIALPEVDETWLQKFTAGLREDQEKFGVFLSGGDTTSTPGPLSISITAMGLVQAGKALNRAGASDGDLVVLSGPVGDAVCGLKALREGIDAPELIRSYYVPELPERWDGAIRAAIDISDGLVQDLAHICKASGVRAEINLDQMRFSAAVQDWLEKGLVSYEDVLTGGDDYQLLMAVPASELKKLEKSELPFQVIGRFQAGAPDVQLIKDGKAVVFQRSGWQHFN